MTKTLYHFVDGKRVEGTSGRFGDVFNPATGEVTARVPLASAEETRAIVASAAAALPGWAATPPAKRAQFMFDYRDILGKHMDELAELLSAEHGKTIPDAKGSVGRGREVVEYACGIAEVLKGEFSENVAAGVDSFTTRQAVGVCAGVTPFNFPAMVPLWMFPMALACGNSFILKPSEKDPSVSIRLAELATEAGLPPGVLNVVNGDKEAVDVLLTDPDVAAISFVGSTPVGEYIYQTGCHHGKRVQALCGAKNHVIVMPDADAEQTADAFIGSAYGSAGERCMAVTLAVCVGDKVADPLVAALAPKVRSLKVGPYTDSASEMGPVISKDSYDKILGYIASGIEEGAELVVDGRNPGIQGHENGYFIGGCLFDRVKPHMKIYLEEIFGPVLGVLRVDNYEDALKLVNDHEYGNGAVIFTGDGDAARDFTTRAKAGMVGVNVPIPVPVTYHSFGGWKRSLFGDHYMHGPEGVRFYTRQKLTTIRWPSDMQAGVRFQCGVS
jgi:malonate-semialdehyde dehydrogenase (acetylating) / methylmalonate-semialdehyde dehydrogenase